MCLFNNEDLQSPTRYNGLEYLSVEPWNKIKQMAQVIFAQRNAW